jgi:hypothetical protein
LRQPPQQDDRKARAGKEAATGLGHVLRPVTPSSDTSDAVAPVQATGVGLVLEENKGLHLTNQQLLAKVTRLEGALQQTEAAAETRLTAAQMELNKVGAKLDKWPLVHDQMKEAAEGLRKMQVEELQRKFDANIKDLTADRNKLEEDLAEQKATLVRLRLDWESTHTKATAAWYDQHAELEARHGTSMASHRRRIYRKF